MKKSSKKSEVLFRIENLCFSVILRLGRGSESLYVVEVLHKGLQKRVIDRYEFTSSRDCEAFIFEYFGYMIIPHYQRLHEGNHLFVY